jgi:hypothetical protein
LLVLFLVVMLKVSCVCKREREGITENYTTLYAISMHRTTERIDCFLFSSSFHYSWIEREKTKNEITEWKTESLFFYWRLNAAISHTNILFIVFLCKIHYSAQESWLIKLLRYWIIVIFIVLKFNIHKNDRLYISVPRRLRARFILVPHISNHDVMRLSS